MKPIFAIVTALAALAYAAPAAEAEAGVKEALEKRQTFGCWEACTDGQRICYSCNPGGCSYTTIDC